MMQCCAGIWCDGRNSEILQQFQIHSTVCPVFHTRHHGKCSLETRTDVPLGFLFQCRSSRSSQRTRANKRKSSGFVLKVPVYLPVAMGNGTSQQTKLEREFGGIGDGEGEERFFGLENFGNTCYCNSVLQARKREKSQRKEVEYFPRLNFNTPLGDTGRKALLQSTDSSTIEKKAHDMSNSAHVRRLFLTRTTGPIRPDL